MPTEIPLPIAFNPYKHHFHFLLNEIDEWKTMDWDFGHKQIIGIGNNLIDFYLGYLMIEQITRETLTILESMQIRSEKQYNAWLGYSKWRKISLSDQSEWILKEGGLSERYIHIHPAKYSIHTIRVKVNTLKTVLALVSRSSLIQSPPREDLFTVNKIRTEMLNLCPLKSLQKNASGILRLWELFSSRNSYPCICKASITRFL